MNEGFKQEIPRGFKAEEVPMHDTGTKYEREEDKEFFDSISAYNGPHIDFIKTLSPEDRKRIEEKLGNLLKII